jgi:hypothetical protein
MEHFAETLFQSLAARSEPKSGPRICPAEGDIFRLEGRPNN